MGTLASSDPGLLRTIELCQRGFFVPFVFISKPAKYGYTVTPDPTDHGKPAEAILASDRAKFEAAATDSIADLRAMTRSNHHKSPP